MNINLTKEQIRLLEILHAQQYSLNIVMINAQLALKASGLTEMNDEIRFKFIQESFNKEQLRIDTEIKQITINSHAELN